MSVFLRALAAFLSAPAMQKTARNARNLEEISENHETPGQKLDVMRTKIARTNA